MASCATTSGDWIMIGYSMFGSNDLPRSFAFYDAVFGSVGIGRLMAFPTGAVAWGTNWTAPMVAIGPPFDGKPATAGNGAMIAIVLDTRAKVDAMHAAALAAGGSDDGPPACAARKARRPFMGPISGIPTATSCARSGWGQPEGLLV
jgi:catechol 2,3-dioxygenase-like lactoylglutathione lyase family enzyme